MFSAETMRQVLSEIARVRRERSSPTPLLKSKTDVASEIDALREGVFLFGLADAEYSDDEQNKLLDALDNVTRVLEDLRPS